MRVVIAIDAFKGSLGSAACGAAAAAGVRDAAPDAEVDVVAVADGGEGTLDALVAALGGRRLAVRAVDALGRPVTAEIGLCRRAGRTVAIVESARTIGLDLVPVDAALPRRAGSHGVGLQVAAALDAGADEVLVTLGGTATTDGGAGLLVALGARVLDADGHPVPVGENPLWQGVGLDTSGLRDLTGVRLTALTDVTAPLAGPTGAAVVFAPQKGSDAAMVAALDARLTRWGGVLARVAGHPVAEVPGAGAAGGLGAALLALGARLEPGFDRVAAEVRLAERIAGADLVLTGEGRLDAQSATGKVPWGVATLARAAGVPVVALAGQVVPPLGALATLLTAALVVHDRDLPLTEAMDPTTTATALRRTAATTIPHTP